jgi:hypothetical protein
MINIYGTLKQFSKRDITREDKEYLEFLIRALIIENYGKDEERKLKEVETPDHYKINGKEHIDEIYDILGSDECFNAFCIGNIKKYTFRHKMKNGLIDLRKAMQYVKYLKIIKKEE